MDIFRKPYQGWHYFTGKIKYLDFLPLLALRVYLAPIFVSAGFNKFNAFGSTVEWFGNPEWGLGLPFPTLLAVLATATEILGGLALLVGFATRLVSIPLILTMVIAIAFVHWPNGWFAIAPSNPDTSMAAILNSVGLPGAAQSLANSAEVGDRLAAAKNLLQTHGHYDWLTQTGRFVVLNNGIEFAVTYLLMLLTLLFQGPGRWVSLDHWLCQFFTNRYDSQIDSAA